MVIVKNIFSPIITFIGFILVCLIGYTAYTTSTNILRVYTSLNVTQVVPYNVNSLDNKYGKNTGFSYSSDLLKLRDYAYPLPFSNTIDDKWKYNMSRAYVPNGNGTYPHIGLDIGIGWGGRRVSDNLPPIYSLFDGKVIAISNASSTDRGKYVVIESEVGGTNIAIVYQHLDNISELQKGQAITTGQLIGTMGNTGKGVSDYHLHLEVTNTLNNSNWNVWSKNGPDLLRTYQPYELLKTGKLKLLSEIKGSNELRLQNFLNGIVSWSTIEKLIMNEKKQR